jgi:hypothetical protein
MACRTDWAITTVNPQPYFDRLAATVEQLGATRSVLRQLITLVDDATTLPDKELRDRLVTVAVRATRLVNRNALKDPDRLPVESSPSSCSRRLAGSSAAGWDMCKVLSARGPSNPHRGTGHHRPEVRHRSGWGRSSLIRTASDRDSEPVMCTPAAALHRSAK